MKSRIDSLFRRLPNGNRPFANVLLALAFLAVCGSAGAQVSFNGVYTENFNGMGTSGTAAPTGWGFYGNLGGSGTTWTSSIPAGDAGLGTLNATLIASTSTTVSSNTQGYNYAASGSTADRCLGSSPTTGRGLVWQLTLSNLTGAPVTALGVRYDLRRFNAPSTANELPGHWLFYSLDNGTTWINASSLNPTITTVPNSTGTSVMVESNLTLASAWAANSTLLLRWADDNAGQSSPDQIIGLDNVAISTAPPAADAALLFNDGQHVTMGTAAALGASSFTIECWFMRTGLGTTASTGSGGVAAVPLVAKGRGEADGSNLDCNYFLGINAAGNLAADFEQLSATNNGTAYNAGQNFPVVGSSVVQSGVWNHAAATYDTTTAQWKLYLNGVEETLTVPAGSPATFVGVAPRSDSIQHFAIGTAMNSSGAREGAFHGVIDEVRVWNVARSGSAIAAAKGTAITTAEPGLLARYGMNEGTGTTLAGVPAAAPSGTLSGSPLWTNGFNAAGIEPPSVTLTAPAEGASYNLPAVVNLEATAADTDGTVAKVEFFAGANKLGEDTTAPYAFAWSGMISGSYVLTARATDNDSAATTSAPVNVTIANPNNVAPSVTLTAPANGMQIAGSSMTLAATANDTDGVIAKVEFYEGANKLGEDTSAPYTYQWSGVTTGTYTVTARAIDNDAAFTNSASADVTFVVPVETTAISRRPAGQPGAVWKYLDNGSDQGTAWKEPTFDDSAWASGAAPLGYTDSHIVTTVFSPASPNRYITTYFRRAFSITGAGAVQALKLNVLRDDGVVVYINGVEVARQNMPEGPINHLTNSASIVDGANETSYFTSDVTTLPLLNEGDNVIAVELHQRDATSSDLGLDLELVTVSLPGTPPTIELTSPTEGATFTAPATIAITADAVDTDGSVAKVEFYNGTEKLGENSSVPFTFDWTTVPQGAYTLTARATDNYGLTTTSDPISINVGPPNTVFPTVTITAPANGAEFLAPGTIAIAATAGDSDGTVTKVEFFNGTTKLGEDTNAPYTFDWSNVPVGSYTLTARATDNLTAATTSTVVLVEVVPNLAPTITLATPLDAATGLGGGGRVNLTTTVSDPENLPLNVTFYGRPKTAPPGQDFTLVTLPDTQFYSENSGGNRLQHFTSQTNWIVSAKDLLNTKFVAHMGDMVQNGDAVQQEWINADGAMQIVENPATTMLTHGIPWGGAPGNHDQQPIGSPDGASLYWNQYFGASRWAGRPYWGGNYSTNNDNNYQLFSASGMDFIVINMEYRPSANQAVLDWADALLKAHPTRRAIITSHWLIDVGNPAPWGGHGQAVYDNLKDNPNLFLMLCGHIHGEGRRADVFEGRTVNTVLQDYQSRANGGDSWLRYFTFKPSENKIYAYTYQTRTSTYETDADSQFTLDYNMAATAPWTDLGTVSLAAGETTATLPWTGLVANTEYEWYAAVSDGVTPVGSTTRSFTASGNATPSVTLTAPADASAVTRPATVNFAATASDLDGGIAKVEFYNGATKVGEDDTAPYAFAWDAPSGVHAVSARAIDGEGAFTDSATAAVTVKFDLSPVVTGGAAGGSVTGGSGVTAGSTASFVAVPNSGYTFVGWTVNGAPSGTNPTLDIVVAEGMTIAAQFAAISSPFTPGNIVVYRVGDGSAALSSAATAVFLDEYTPTGTFVQSVPLPTTVSGSQLRLVASGTSTSEGILSRSADGQYLIATGYDAAPGTAGVTASATTTTKRVIARIDPGKAVNTTTGLTAFSASNIRGATSSDGTAFWATGANTGVVYAPLGMDSTTVSTSVTNTRTAGIFGGQLYVSSGSGTNTFRGINAVGTGLPTTAGSTTVRLPGLTDTTNPSTYGFFFADLDAGVAGADTLYVADDAAGALTKFALVSGSWVSKGVVSTDLDYRGLAGTVSGGIVTLFATRDNSTSPDQIVTLVDASGYNGNFAGTPTTLATAATNTAIRGIAMAPEAAIKLLITEVESSQAQGSRNDFWELTNVGIGTVDLGNWKWDDDSRNPADAAAVTIPAGTMIAPGESIIFTGLSAATFRTWWGLAPTVQVISTGAAPGLGQNDAVALFNASGTEMAYLSYVAGGFTRTDGSPSAGGHAGASAGGSATAAAIWNPSFGTTSPRYSAAVVGALGAFASAENAGDVGSPGFSGYSAGGGPATTLSLSATSTTFSESAVNPASVGTVTRSVSAPTDLTVNLSSSDATEATVPATVTILANQTTANFDITAVNDTFPDGNKTATITASATGITPGTLDLTVQDDADVLDTSFFLTEIQSNQSAGKPVTANDYWELTNISASSKDISGYSWHDSGRSGASASAYKLPAGTTIAAGESVIFTAMPAADFRLWWNLPPTVQVFQSVGAPGLGQADGISFFDNGQNELFFFSYAAAGFTKEDGSPSTGAHAGPSAGGSADSQALIWVPSSGTTTPRYTAATGSNHGSFSAVAPATDLGSPGTQGALIPTVNLSNNSAVEGDGGSTLLPLTVTRSDTTTAFTVDYAVTGGSATSPGDYTLASGMLTFTAGGAPTQAINLTIKGDTVPEPDETVVVSLSNVVNTTGATVVGTANGTATILNDDVIAPNLTLQVGGSTIATGGVTTLRVAVSGNPAPTLQWYQGNKGDTSNPVGGATFPTLLTGPLAGTTNFWVRASNGGGDFDSDTITVTAVAPVTSLDLSNYVRIGRYDLPEPTRTTLPAGTPVHNLLCQEASGVAYNPDTDTLFVVADGGRSVTQVSKTGVLIDTMTLALGTSPQGTDFYDIEGIAYIGGGQFVMSEERDRQIVKFTYAAGTTLSRSGAQTVDLGAFVDNTGTEGLSYDPLTSGFICLKEISPLGIFQTTADFAAGTASNGSPTTVNSIDLFDPALAGMVDFADVFALSNLPAMSGQPQQPNLLLLSHESARVVSINRSGVIASTLNIQSDPGNPFNLVEQQHEGLSLDRAGFLYIVNENGGGDSDHPQLWVYAPATAPNAAPTGLTINNATNSIMENSDTGARVPLGDIVALDDGLGVNVLSLSGTDAAFFEIVGTGFFLKSGVILDFETKGSYDVTINVNDTTVGTSTPDASLPYTLTVLDQNPETTPPPSLLITEVAPWSSGNSPVASDWFEVTNISSNSVNITGWKMDDSSASSGASVALNGITTIAPGESVIFLETADLPGKSATFRSHWFGASPPAGLQIGSYTGSGVGLGTTGDGVFLFDSVGQNRGGISFGASPVGPSFPTFDNTAGLHNLTVSRLSLPGVNGAFAASANPVEVGSPGYSAPGKLVVTEVAPWSSGNSPVGADWFEVTNIGAGIVDLTGWRVDDSSESPAAALALIGVGSIAPGESVIFIESSSPSTTVPAFLSNWFGANPPAGLQVGTYSGGGIGLSTGGDAVNLYDPTNVRRTNLAFGASPVASPFGTFDNSARLEVATISQLSVVGTNGAFVAANSAIEIGSPGVTNKAPSVGGSILTQAASSGSPFSLVVPVGTFTDPEGLPLTYSATRGDGSPLPAWLTFNGPARSFSGTPGALDAGNLVVKLIATDSGTPGLANSTTFTIQVAPPVFTPGYTSSSIDVLTPNTGIWNPAGVNVNGTQFVNLGLQGVGRVPANSIDPATGESIGSVSDMQISGWKKNPDGSYAGTFHFLPDRGYNSGTIFSNYAARLNDFTFTFTPYTGAAPTTLQNQIAMTFGGSRRFTYDHDGSAGTPSIFTTGLLATGKVTLFGMEIPTVTANTTQSDGTFANRLTVDAEGLILDSRPSKAGSGWVSDEYGPYIYHFNASGQIDGQLQLPAALVPHNPVGTTTFSTTPANLNGRRENQGMEGIAQSPDGTKLFALLQSATLQDSGAGNQNRYNTRLLVYDISSSDTPTDPIDQYVIQLPRLDTDTTAGVDRTGAQSAILALNDHQLLILSRDGNGRGVTTGPPVFKSVLLAELNGATDIDGTYDAEAAAVAPGAVLNALVTPLSWKEALNMLGKIDATTQELSRFNLNLNTPPGDLNTLGEKWEALSMVSANDPANPNDYFLFIGNDNDFASQTGVYKDAAGVNQPYNAGLENDTVVLAYRVRMTGPDNQAPFNGMSLTDQSTTKGGAFSFQVPAVTFTDPEGQSLNYSATRADGSPLPTWLTFDPGTRTFSGTPGPGDVGNLVIRLIATDNGIPPLLRTTTFTINVAEQLPPPSLLTGPSTTVAPYLTSHLPGVSIQSLLTTGDGQTVPKVGGGTTRLVGICDGLGAYDNGDGTFTILMNHEITNTQGITRAHGAVGSFVSKWVVDKITKQVVSGDDLIKQVFTWGGSAYALSGSPFAFDRLCSADLPAATALLNSGSGKGSSARLYLNGEETSGGRAFAHVVTGPDAGKSYHLAHFGFTNFENVLLSPKPQDKTIAIMTNDSGDGEVFVYVGTKNNTGATEPEKAGLTGGTLYGLAVPGKPFELSTDAALAVGPTEPFTLVSIGGPGNYPTNGTDTNNRATTAGVLQLGGPEDGAWDTRPGYEDTFYFVTKGTSSNGINAPTRLWKMEFTDIANPENGGTLTLLLDGPDLRLGSCDNMTCDDGKLLIQEDLGDDERLSKIWEYDLTTGEMEEVAEHRGNYFYTGGANFLTINEESSGIIPLRSILGAGWYAASVQVHTNSHIASGDRTELVEGGQLVLLNLNNRERDLVRTPLVEHGDTWKYDATGSDPGATWKNVGFSDGAWSSGPSMLGYGDDTETQTDIPAPGTPTTRPAATYYRTTFDVANPASTILLDLYMKWDDGAVVYINGVEVARPNMSRTAAVTHTTFAAVNDPLERDWKPVSIPCENLNLQPTGNVLAISIHQENASSSDTRIDAELFAWSKSPDPGTAPALPTGLAVSNPTNDSLDLDWNAQSDAKFFVIERQKTGELTWQVIDGDVPGTFTGYTDLALAGGATYSYRIWAVNQHGASACTAPQSGTTTNVIIPTIFFEDFSTTTNSSQTGSFTTETGIRTQSLASSGNWYVAGPFGTLGKVANGNGFGRTPAGEGSDEWMFLPPLNTDFYSGELFSFLSDARFNDTGLAGLPAGTVPTASTGLDVLISTNYDPAIHTDPRTATWTLLNPQATFDTDFTGFGSGVASGGIDLSSLQGIATIAFRYRSSGTVSNAARHWEVTDFQILGSAGIDFETATGLAPFTAVSTASNRNWAVATMAARAGASGNNFGGDVPADDWLISPAFASVFDNTAVSFDYFDRFADLGAIPQGKTLAVLVSTNYDPAIHTNPSSATWRDITPAGLDGSVSNAWKTLSNVPLGLTGTNWNVHVAFRYQSSGTGSNAAKQVGIDKVVIGRGGGSLGVDFNFTQTGNESTFTPSISGGTEPYTVSWNFGDSSTATGDSPSHIFANNGNYTVTVTVTDAAGASTTATKNVVTNFTEFAIPAKAADLRVATFNTAMNSDDINGNAGDANAVANALASGTHPSIKKVAEVIQRLNPDVVFLNEVDLAYIGQTFDAAGTLARVDNFRTKYLGVAQAGDTTAVTYPYHYIGGTNTGLASGYDLRNQGGVDTTPGDQGYGDDSFGFGQFPGKYGFVVLSKYPIDTANARTFQKFLWKDMPGALLPEDPADTDGNSSTASFYTPAELNVFRLSSKNHWDVPVMVGGQAVHLLCSHPTPPVFDDGETLTHGVATGTPSTKSDWNGLRNNDEIRFWADYIDPAKDDYIYDDSEVTVTGTDAAGNQLYTGTPTKQGLGAGESFVIVGDLNSDPVDGDSSFAGVTSLTTSTFVDTSITPESTGSLEQVPGSFSNRAQKTSSFNLRADYALPSVAGLDLIRAGVHWPKLGDATSYLLAASDHRSTWVDLDLTGQITVDPIITGGAGGSVNGGGAYAPGSTATFTAVPSTGYKFVGWTVNGAPAGSTNPLSVNVTPGLEVEATFVYVLQVLHYYGESGLLGVQTAPIMGAMIDKFDNDYANTLVLGEGDSFIPGPWLVGGADPSLNAVPGIGTTALGRPDIAIMNAFGTTASALGNHEFDLGSPVLQSAITPAGSGGAAWVGAQFPLITANLDFSADSSLRGIADATLGGTGTNAFAGQDVSAIKAKIAPYAIKTLNGEKIGFVGATTWELLSKSSPNGTVPKDDGNAATSDLQEVAAYVQAAVNALQTAGVNKIVLVDQLDTLQRNKDLAGLVSGIDIMVAGGGHEYMKDANDVPGTDAGHTTPAADAYPISTVGADGKPVLIVTTDTEYSYLGRLVVDFNTNGELILGNLDNVINGAYASNAATLQSVYNTVDPASTIIGASVIGTKVKAIADAINNVVSAKDGNIFGFTSVYLEGDRVFGRTQEVNLGNITADANAAKARAALGLAADAAVFSLKNGGGLRASIGSIDASGNKIPPIASGVKAAGAISQLDIENALRFDNKLMVFDTTPQGLLAILNYAAGLSASDTAQSGGYPQVGNLRFSYDRSLPAGQKVRSVALYDEDGNLVAPIVAEGTVLPGAPAVIQCVSLSFTANGGDGYPIKANADNFRYLLANGSLSAAVSESLDFTVAGSYTSVGLTGAADVLGEQVAFQQFLVAKHANAGSAYNVADTPTSGDLRIQILSSRSDTVLDVEVTPSVTGNTGGSVTGGGILAAGSTAAFTALPDAGFLFRGWLVNGVASPETSPTLEVIVTAGLTVEATFTRGIVRPDGAVGKSVTSLTGVGAYGPVETQEYFALSRRLKPVKAVTTITNRGDFDDTLRVRSTPGNRDFAVTHLQAGRNITAALATGRFETGAINQDDASVVIQTTITPNKRTLTKAAPPTRPNGAPINRGDVEGSTTGRRGDKKKIILSETFAAQITVSSTADPALRDTVQIRVTTR